jgi:hypothetical protein
MKTLVNGALNSSLRNTPFTKVRLTIVLPVLCYMLAIPLCLQSHLGCQAEHAKHLRAACEQQSSLINRSTAASGGLTNALKQASQTLDNQTTQLRNQRQCILSLERTRDQALQLLTESESVRRSMGEIIAQKKLAVAQLQREIHLLRKQADMQSRLLKVLAPDLGRSQSAASSSLATGATAVAADASTSAPDSVALRRIQDAARSRLRAAAEPEPASRRSLDAQGDLPLPSNDELVYEEELVDSLPLPDLDAQGRIRFSAANLL